MPLLELVDPAIEVVDLRAGHPLPRERVHAALHEAVGAVAVLVEEVRMRQDPVLAAPQAELREDVHVDEPVRRIRRQGDRPVVRDRVVADRLGGVGDQIRGAFDSKLRHAVGERGRGDVRDRKQLRGELDRVAKPLFVRFVDRWRAHAARREDRAGGAGEQALNRSIEESGEARHRGKVPQTMADRRRLARGITTPGRALPRPRDPSPSPPRRRSARSRRRAPSR